jgi:hypothetical protein
MFPISYRDLELMLLDRGVEVDHTTIFRWIQAYAAALSDSIARRSGWLPPLPISPRTSFNKDCAQRSSGS